MFSEKLTTLMSLIGASATDLAALAGFDRTNISRLRSGKRIPGPDSSTAAKLINGIYLFAYGKNALKALCSLTGAGENDPADAIRRSIGGYLYDGCDQSAAKHTGTEKKRNHTGPRKHSNVFPERLGLSMALSGLSNAHLSRLVYSDPSLISRYRSGVRTPAANPELSLQISEVLYDRIIKNGKKEELSGIVNVPLSELDEEVYLSWLFSQGDEAEDNALATERLLGFFDSFRPDTPPAMPDLTANPGKADAGEHR